MVTGGAPAPEWDALPEPWRVCLEELWAAYRAGSVPHGAAVTDATGRVLTRGRNRALEAAGGTGRLAGNPLAHAELNALVALDYARTDQAACVLWTSTEPCPLCTAAVAMAGVGAVRFAARDAYGGGTPVLQSTPLLRARGVRVVGPERAVLEAAIVAVRVEFRLRRRGGAAGPVVEAAEASCPAGARLGRALYESGTLGRLRDAGAGAADVFGDLLARPDALDVPASQPETSSWPQD